MTARTDSSRSGSSSSDGITNGMSASRILDFPRTMRCAIVPGAVRNAPAISSVVSPHTSRSVSGTCTLRSIAGWQQAKMSRRRSSSISCDARAALASAISASRPASSGCRVAKWPRRRRASIALKRPVDTSHARGLSGTPSRVQRSTATANAS